VDIRASLSVIPVNVEDDDDGGNMHRPHARRLSPHRFEFDPSRFEGRTTLGEPLGLLFSAALRLQFGASHGGLAPVSATWTTEEGNAIERAMSRVEEPRSNDPRTTGQRDTDRLVAVLMQVMRDVEQLA
jgi:hypothetical protein